MPSSGSASISSAFPAAMASMLGVREKCTGRSWIAVMLPVRERVGHEPMAIATVAEREEHAPGLRDARIERAPSEAVRQVRDAVDHPSTRRAEHLLEGEHALPNGTVGGLRPPAPGPPHGRSGCTRAYLSASVAMPLKAVIAGRVPSSFDSGRSRTTTTTSCGSSAGTNPANDEMYASST